MLSQRNNYLICGELLAVCVLFVYLVCIPGCAYQPWFDVGGADLLTVRWVNYWSTRITDCDSDLASPPFSSLFFFFFFKLFFLCVAHCHNVLSCLIICACQTRPHQVTLTSEDWEIWVWTRVAVGHPPAQLQLEDCVLVGVYMLYLLLCELTYKLMRVVWLWLGCLPLEVYWLWCVCVVNGLWSYIQGLCNVIACHQFIYFGNLFVIMM